jgi:excisionase family DNA binding protein
MEKQLYTIKESAIYLGMAEITIRKWIQANKIKSVKVGSSRRIPLHELERLAKGE